ncbi:MAG TPA: hypothetical protein VH796_11020 [Nitrososphaeraceae archaeon]|jgi:hypothetical protein
MFPIQSKMITKTKAIFFAMIVASLTVGIAATMSGNTLSIQSAHAQGYGGTPMNSPPPGGASSAGPAPPGNSTSGNATK